MAPRLNLPTVVAVMSRNLDGTGDGVKMPLQENESGRWTLYVREDGRLSDIYCPQFGDRRVEVVPATERDRYREALEGAAEKFAELGLPVYADACREVLDD
jgi:hypothetical protein